MHVTVTTADTSGEPIENAPIVAEEMERRLREADGFEVPHARARRQGGRARVLGRLVAERHGLARAQFRERMLSIAGVRIEDVVDYDVVFARLGPGFAAAVDDRG